MASGLENVREHTDEIASKQNAWFGAHVFHRTRSCEIWEGKDIVEPQMVYNRALDVCVDVSFVDAATRRHNGRKGSGGPGGGFIVFADNSRRKAPAQGVMVGWRGLDQKRTLFLKRTLWTVELQESRGKKNNETFFFLVLQEVLVVLCGSVTCTQN